VRGKKRVRIPVTHQKRDVCGIIPPVEQMGQTASPINGLDVKWRMALAPPTTMVAFPDRVSAGFSGNFEIFV
jgi:hypothetical protein